MWDHIMTFLPRLDTATQIEELRDARVTTFRWYDPVQQTDVSLTVDSSTGVPRELRHVARPTGLVSVVSDSDWNRPVDINPPRRSPTGDGVLGPRPVA
jgi:hypothetical protein